jgi:hypothetical protein
MDVVTSPSPEVTDLLWLDITPHERRARKRWGGDLQDRQRYREVACQRLSDTWNGRNQRRQRDLPGFEFSLGIWDGRGACQIGERNERKK